MIISAHGAFYKRILPYAVSPVLMLGNQQLQNGYANPFPAYKTFDPDGGDYTDDLSGDLTRLHSAFGSIVNIGTIEHVWDVHGAFCNVASMLKVGGYYAGSSPIAGYADHGIHLTGARYVELFFKLNGFEVVDRWYTDRFQEVPEPLRTDTLFWIITKKVASAVEFVKPQQVYKDGLPVRVRS